MPVQFGSNMFKQFDYGRAVMDGQQIQHNQLRNAALGDEQEQRRNMLKGRQEAQKIRQMYDQMPDQIAALEESGLFDQADQLRDQYISTRKTEVELLTNMRSMITADNYKGLRQDLIQAGAVTPDMMPVEYSDAWLKKEISKRRGAITKFTRDSFKNGALMSQDFVQQDGEIRWDLTGQPYQDPKKQPGYKPPSAGDGKPFQLKSSDANAIARQVERVFGGFHDPATGQLQGLNPEKTKQVQAVQEEAERLYLENEGSVPHGVAVARAARKLGVNVEDIRNAEATDPLKLRQ